MIYVIFLENKDVRTNLGNIVGDKTNTYNKIVLTISNDQYCHIVAFKFFIQYVKCKLHGHIECVTVLLKFQTKSFESVLFRLEFLPTSQRVSKVNIII